MLIVRPFFFAPQNTCCSSWFTTWAPRRGMWRYCTSRRPSPGSSLPYRPFRHPATGKCHVVPYRVADPHQFIADPEPAFHFNADPDLAFHLNADPDLDLAPHTLMWIRIWILLLINWCKSTSTDLQNLQGSILNSPLQLWAFSSLHGSILGPKAPF